MGNSDSSDLDLKIGAIVAGGALLAYGAWKLASSSMEDRDEQNSREPSQGIHGYLSRTITSDVRKTATANKSVYGFGENARQNASKTRIKIMTYNVWLHEDVEIKVRMKAICDLIEQHAPDVILFQEVTPNIYTIFRSYELRDDYRWSLTPAQATGQSNFCLMLSKLPMSNETDETNLPIASISISNLPKINLMIATTHLPQQTKPREKNRAARIKQAKQSIDTLNCFTNVVFGGDMNWVDEFDGPFPLKNKWVDAWLELKPNEDGSTFNTKSNGMLAGRRRIQQRLDRFMCKLQDFKLIDIEIIGSDPIPEASYKNQLNGDWVPVYPSDHFGLVLTIELK